MISARGAASPSMLKMLSVTTTMRALGLAERRAQRRRDSSLAVSLWGKMRRVAPLSLAPSMREAWQSLSRMRMSSREAMAVRVPTAVA